MYFKSTVPEFLFRDLKVPLKS